VDAVAATGSLGPGDPGEELLAEGGTEVSERGRDGIRGHASSMPT
jgi:hypothetical protein